MPCAFHYQRPEPYENLDRGCQFRPEEKMYAHAGDEWCRFHLPLEAKDHEGYVKRDWVDDKRNNFFDVLFSFIGARIGVGAVDLSGVQFLPNADFGKYCHDNNEIPLAKGVFANAVFADGCKFEGVIFEDRCTFDAATFGDDAVFTKGRFGDRTSFKSVMFGNNCRFDRATFGESCEFSLSTFGEDCSFRLATFGNSVSFEQAHFGANCKFIEAFFGGGCSFLYAKFATGSEWMDATFGERCTFDYAEFSGHTRFYGTRFGAKCSFRNARFLATGHPDDRVSFAARPDSSDPLQLGFKGIYFEAADFRVCAQFTNRKFYVVADFERATFHVAPEFHECKLHQDTTFPGLKGFPDTKGDRAARAYQTLKLAMEQVRAHEEQGMFYALEQRSRRNQMSRWNPGRWASTAYDLTAGYGRSFERASDGCF